MSIRMKCLFLVLLLLSGSACRREAVAPASERARQSGIQTDATPDAGRSKIGFASRQKWLEHFEKHGGEFSARDANEYLRIAQALRDAPVGGNILEVVRRDGVSTRFDRSTGTFLAFNTDGTIRTCFKPIDGENYFRRQSRR